MAWPEATRASYAADQSVPLGNVQALEARDHWLYEHAISGYFAEASTASASPTYATIATLIIWVPTWVAQQLCTLNASIEGKVSAGTGTWRLRDSTDTVDGSASTGITSTSYVNTTSAVVHTASNGRAEHTIIVEGHCTGGGTIYLRSLGIEFWWSE